MLTRGLTQELSDIQKGSDLAIAVACRDIDVRNIKALIVGPHETPSPFVFIKSILPRHRTCNASQQTKGNADLTPTYTPTAKFACRSSGNGPGFHILLSRRAPTESNLLGRTWRGERSEEWSSAQGLESILLSIQSLLSANPYENEPGFEDANGESDQKMQREYVQKIRHENLRISIIQRLESYLGLNPDGSRISNDAKEAEESEVPFEPFKDLCKRRFLWYYTSYLTAIERSKLEVKERQAFVRMPFESQFHNSMEGRFNYPELERRLKNIKAFLDAEPNVWAEEGVAAMAQETTVCVNLQHQFEQVSAALKRGDMPHDVTLEDGNPFVWIITYFGRPMTNLDGGLFRIRMNFSPRFPDEQPRVRFETRIFHHHVADDGTACYSPNPLKREDIGSHIAAIFAVLEEDDPAYDPREIVNPEATRMYWGGDAEKRKMYNRRLRRSVQQSLESASRLPVRFPACKSTDWPQGFSGIDLAADAASAGFTRERKCMQIDTI
ncbi:Ubiquitin-conjugating enzyme/RWD-like protein [Drechmeria coniospora]|uniref:Ubiquitin-conjugating enzyme/RWD-like protein n=1 Tax=Drechmeria coniospora TaxID=98403 RepID=A0A151GEC0_DRECN|nr:Ubiquitin-conjugating enzyme/RWD-like protein [Drechmeria coniospora]KYK55423.1 Ubiquitin-conjugating enzyme/RWD-like protein [Drechmeria coniospora]